MYKQSTKKERFERLNQLDLSEIFSFNQSIKNGLFFLFVNK